MVEYFLICFGLSFGTLSQRQCTVAEHRLWNVHRICAFQCKCEYKENPESKANRNSSTPTSFINIKQLSIRYRWLERQPSANKENKIDGIRSDEWCTALWYAQAHKQLYQSSFRWFGWFHRYHIIMSLLLDIFVPQSLALSAPKHLLYSNSDFWALTLTQQ